MNFPGLDDLAPSVSSQNPEKTATFLGRIGQIAGLVAALAASPSTAILDPWFLEQRRRDSSTWAFKRSIGRSISRIEALQIAREIIQEAERERLELIEAEAAIGIQWMD